MGDPYLISLLAGVCLLLLSACEFSREGPQELPQQFLGADTKLLAHDLVEINVTVLRPRPGALMAYADCVGSQYALIRGMDYARRVTLSTWRTGMADAVGQKVTYLISPLRPDGQFVLTARQVVDKCKANGIPTV